MAGQPLYEAVMPTGVPPGKDMSSEDPTIDQQASPEEQGAFDQVVSRVVAAMDEKQDLVIKKLNNNERPVHENVAETAVMYGKEAVNIANQLGTQLTPEITHAVGVHLVEILMDLGDAAGIWPFERTDPKYEEEMNNAVFQVQNLIGDETLKSDDGTMQDRAANFVAQQVAREADEGTIDPNYQGAIEGMAKRAGGLREVPKS